MKINILYFCLCCCLLTACVEDAPSTKVTEVQNTTKKKDEMVVLRDPVNIISSTGEDYPKTLQDIGFPVMPNSEVSNVGNTDIVNGTVVMQMETTNTIEQIKQFYKNELVSKGWMEKEANIYQGADGALSFQSDKYSARILILKDRVQDFRKVAVTLNKKVNPAEFEASRNQKK